MRRRTFLALGAALPALHVLKAAAAELPVKAELTSTYRWSSDNPKFGGISGFEVADDGRTFTAISDKGYLVRGKLHREGGRITSLSHSDLVPLTDPDGRPVGPHHSDAEGLAIRDDGRLFVSFEGNPRVWSYQGSDAAEWLPQPEAFVFLQTNAGLEALAIDARGWLYTLPERSGDLNRDYPVFRYRPGGWDMPFKIQRRGGFSPVGADIGPDGRFYLLERLFTGFGFQTRVRRFTLSDTSLTNEETLLETPTHRHDNLEGLAVWRDDTGHICLTMVSDDNFNFFQKTEIVEYRVTE